MYMFRLALENLVTELYNEINALTPKNDYVICGYREPICNGIYKTVNKLFCMIIIGSNMVAESSGEVKWYHI